MSGSNMFYVQLGQTPKTSDVAFFEMKVPIVVSNGSLSDTLWLDHKQNNQKFSVQLKFAPTSVTADPDAWILAKYAVSKNALLATEGQTLEGVSVYPSPADGFVNIEVPQGKYVYKLRSLATGQLLQEQPITGTVRIDVSEHPAGLYLVSLLSADGKGRFEQKVLVQH